MTLLLCEHVWDQTPFQADHLTSLGLSFLVCEIEILPGYFSYSVTFFLIPSVSQQDSNMC